MTFNIATLDVLIQHTIRTELALRADMVKAPLMQAYAKSPLPFYGVQSAGQTEVWHIVRAQHPPLDWDSYTAVVKTVWFGAKHHEEKYLALRILNGYPKHRLSKAIDLYEELLE